MAAVQREREAARGAERAELEGANARLQEKTELQASKDAVGNAFAKHEARAAVERSDAWAWACLVPKAIATAEDAEGARKAATDALA